MDVELERRLRYRVRESVATAYAARYMPEHLEETRALLERLGRSESRHERGIWWNVITEHLANANNRG